MSDADSDYIELSLVNYLPITTEWFVAEGWPGKSNAAQDLREHPNNVLVYLYNKLFSSSFQQWEAKLLEAGEGKLFFMNQSL